MIPGAMAGMMMGNKMRATCTFVGGFRNGADIGTTTITETGANAGPASADRYLLAIFSGGTGTATGITSCTIGGVSATQILEDGASGDGFLSMWIALVPTGTTVNISAPVTGSANYTASVLYAITGLLSATPTDTDIQTLAASATGTATVTTQTDGILISAYSAYDTSANNAVAWSGTSGVVEDLDDPSAGPGIVFSCASVNTTTGASQTAICNPGTTTSSERIGTVVLR